MKFIKKCKFTKNNIIVCAIMKNVDNMQMTTYALNSLNELLCTCASITSDEFLYLKKSQNVDGDYKKKKKTL